MPNLLATASQVANSLSNLKAKYIRYLESLCAANGIDISTLKTEGDGYTILEMYFGGLPVLVGLKYFTSLSCLRLFGQQITSLKPLGEVASTLEELWVCEGVIKDLTGIETCVRLKKLFLYENLIEDASCLSSLTLLQILDLSANKLRNLAFLHSLRDLTTFSVSNNKMKDSVIATALWPENIQHLDISANSFSSYKALFPLTVLHSLRSLHINPLAKSETFSPDIFFAWIAHSFKFIESIDDDILTDNFVPTYRPTVDTILGDRMGRIVKIDEKFNKDLRMAEKHVAKIENRLACLADALATYRDLMQTKDAKKEIVKRVHEICTNNSRNVKNVKKNYARLCEFHRTLGKYRIAFELESSNTLNIRDGTKEEIGLLTQTLNYNCSMKNLYEISIKSCSMFQELDKSDIERLFLLERDSHDALFDIRSIFHLVDRHQMNDYTKLPVKIVRDFEIIKKQNKEKTIVFFVPMVLSRTSTTRGNSKIIEEDGMSSTSSDNLMWADIKLVSILAVEIHSTGQITTDQIRYIDKFEETWLEQFKKLNEMNIKLDLKEGKQKKIEDITEHTIEDISIPQTKVRKVIDVLGQPKSLWDRVADIAIPLEWFSTRTLLDISIAYFGCRPFKDTMDIALKITTLDLSEQKLTKLHGIQELVSLQFLSIRKNKIASLKKLMRLPTLRFLDASSNHVGKLDNLPSTLIFVDLSQNRLQNLAFCQTLTNARDIRVQRNQIKSLKSLEFCVQLETFFVSDNMIKDKMELEVFKPLTKLIHLDISSNPISAAENFKSKIAQYAPSLISLDRCLVPVEERSVNTNKQTTRGLSIELIEKICPEWKNKQELMICDQKIEQLIFEKSQIEELSHVRLIDLSKNKLASVKKLNPLNITHLVLDNNCIRLIAVFENQLQPFKNLETLSLVSNGINNSTILRMGLQYLQKLKNIDLSFNALSKFDCALFDLPCLDSINLSNNAIKTIVRKSLRSLTHLQIQNNKLTSLSPLNAQNLISLDCSENKMDSCASLKPLCEMKNLEILDCRGNTVTERRVYVDFVKSQVPSVKKLDGEEMLSELSATKRRLSRASELVSLSRRSSMVTSSTLSWFEKEEAESLDTVSRATSFLEIPNGKSKGKGITHSQNRGAKYRQDEGFMLFGIK
ncbi:unnamed protein product [Caenorhabditis bovis]|uniref:Uncharacterized protein n=1 Tax=Caenorhabditis bovis TaxID=2654633 RepID=A0A8S1E7V4_9PELO|nr:unnamed protein product [Caenorhabditis bovis]